MYAERRSSRDVSLPPYPRCEVVEAWGWVWEYAEFQFLSAEELAWPPGQKGSVPGFPHSTATVLVRGTAVWQVGDRRVEAEEGDLLWIAEGSPQAFRAGASGCRAFAARFTARAAGAQCLLALLGFPDRIRGAGAAEADLRELVRLQRYKPAGWRQRATGLVAGLVLRVVHEHPEKLSPALGVRQLRALRWLCPVLHLADRSGPAVAVREMAEALAWSPSHLRRVFRECLGTSPREWLLERRLRKAADLLVATEHSVEEVARAVGYESLSHFHRAFKRRFGCTPGVYRSRLLAP